MPYESKAQQRKIHSLEAEGKIDPKTVQEFDQSTDFANLPERKHPKKTTRQQLRDAIVNQLKTDTQN